MHTCRANAGEAVFPVCLGRCRRLCFAWALPWLAAALTLSAAPSTAAIPDSYRKLWADPAVQQRIEQNIARHRQREAVLEVVTADGRPVADAAVAIHQRTHEFLFGCNAFVLGQLDTPEKNRKYEEAFVRLFNFATVPFYWEGTEPTQGELRYAEGARDMWRRPPADRYPPFAKKHGLTLKGHPLLWHAYNPSWLPKDAEALKALYQKRFAEIGSRYAQDIAIWDVVNESQVCSKTYPLYTPDRAYVAWAFQEAARHFRPENTLMINEVTSFNRGVGEKNAYYRQVQELLRQGARVQGIGFQFHFFSSDALQKYMDQAQFPPAEMLDVYDSFAAFQRPLFVTEITVPTPPVDGAAVQAEVVRDLYRLWFSAPQMAGITWWNLGDGTAVKGENAARGGLLDDQLEPKDSYRVLDQLINHDWKTHLDSRTDQRGRVCFRGFHGRYTVRVTAGAAVREFSVDLTKAAPAEQRLVLAAQEKSP